MTRPAQSASFSRNKRHWPTPCVQTTSNTAYNLLNKWDNERGRITDGQCNSPSQLPQRLRGHRSDVRTWYKRNVRRGHSRDHKKYFIIFRARYWLLTMYIMQPPLYNDQEHNVTSYQPSVKVNGNSVLVMCRRSDFEISYVFPMFSRASHSCDRRQDCNLVW